MAGALQCFRRIVSVASLLALCGCGTMGDAFYAVSFDRAKDVSGITKGQQGKIALIVKGSRRFEPEQIADITELDAASLSQFKDSLGHCYDVGRLPARPSAGTFWNGALVGPLASLAVSFVGTAVYNFVVERLQDESKKLSAESSKSYGASVVGTVDAAGQPAFEKASCVVFFRETTVAATTPESAETTEPGLIVVMRRIDKGGTAGGSTWAVTYFWIGNAVAVTGKGEDGKNPSVGVSVALAISAPIADPKSGGPIPVKPIASILFKPIQAEIGKTAKVCPAVPESEFYTCQFESDLVSNIPSGLTALQVTVGISEVGSGAKADEKVAAGIKALNETVKPTYTALVGLLAAAVKGD